MLVKPYIACTSVVVTAEHTFTMSGARDAYRFPASEAVVEAVGIGEQRHVAPAATNVRRADLVA